MKEKMNQAKDEKKNKHNKTIITRIWVGAAAAIAAFVILPNTSPSVAYAMEQIPLLGNLIEVVTFRDYQYSSDRNNADVNVPKLVPETVASTEITTEEPVGENLKKSTDEINAEIEKIIRQLDTLPNRLKAPDVLASALNATANEMKKKIGQRTRKRYAISNKKILTDRKMGGMYTKKATGSNGEATLFSRGGMLEVMNYMTRKNTESTAAMLKILNDSPMTALEVDGRKAFEATFQSGHTAIVQRMSSARLPIKKLMAPAVPMLYGKTYEEATQDYYSILQKHIQREVERVLDGFGRAA